MWDKKTYNFTISNQNLMDVVYVMPISWMKQNFA